MVHTVMNNVSSTDGLGNITGWTMSESSTTDFAPGQLCGYADGTLGCSMCTDDDFLQNRIEGCASQWLNGGAFECPLAESRQPARTPRQPRKPRARARAAPVPASRR